MALPKSKYEEDVYINNHTSVWGSWWKDHQWGYKCCKQVIRNSYCTGAAGIEASEAVSDLMRANIARKEATEGNPIFSANTPWLFSVVTNVTSFVDLWNETDSAAPVEDKKFATWGTDIPEDLVLDEKLLAKSLKKVGTTQSEFF